MRKLALQIAPGTGEKDRDAGNETGDERYCPSFGEPQAIPKRVYGQDAEWYDLEEKSKKQSSKCFNYHESSPRANANKNF